MRAAIYGGPRGITAGERPDPAITAPTDAVVRVVLGCVCGSDLWYYRGESPHAQGSIGHEFIGVVEQVGTEVRGITRGDRGFAGPAEALSGHEDPHRPPILQPAQGMDTEGVAA